MKPSHPHCSTAAMRSSLDRQGSFDYSIGGSSQNSFREKDFQLPDLEITNSVDYETLQQEKRTKTRRNSVVFELHKEKQLLVELDEIAKAPDVEFCERRGVIDRAIKLKVARGDKEAKAEMAVLNHVLKRKPGEWKDEVQVLEEIMNGTYDGDDADEHLGIVSIDHPKLGSVQEKIEDHRQQGIEAWCKKHCKLINQKYTNKEKRLLRKWFEALDYDGSGEVNVEELQDPMLSSGILKTREQVVRVLANVDKNNTMGIDFEEFLLALGSNKLADQDKLRKLQEMSADPNFSTDTLIAIERRKKLMKSILKRCEDRQNEVDRLYRKYDKAKLTKREKDQFHIEREALEEEHAKSIYLHLKYITALDGVIEDKKRFYLQQTKAKELSFEDRINQLSSQDMYRTITQIRFGGNKNGASRQDMMNKIEVAVATNGLQPIRGRGTAIAMAMRGAGGGGSSSSGLAHMASFGTPSNLAMGSIHSDSTRSGTQPSAYSETVFPLRNALVPAVPRASISTPNTMPPRHAMVQNVVRSHKDLIDNPFKIYAPIASRMP